MKVIVTGGAGFLGRRLARALLERGALTGPSGRREPIDALVLFDAEPAADPALDADARVTAVPGDVGERDQVFALIDRDDISVFHLASVVSGEGERDFDRALRVNLEGGRNVLEACRARGGRPRVVAASSIAVFGGANLPETVDDHTKQTPETTYGTTKAILELLVNDYTRKGFLDGRAARLPTVVVRPGAPNAAASAFASAVIREPLNGEPCRLPVPLTTVMPVIGHRAAVAGLVRLHEADGAALGGDRALMFPGLAVTLADMVRALEGVAGDRRLGEITVEPDPFVERIVAGWPRATAAPRARALGIAAEADAEALVRAYIEDFL